MKNSAFMAGALVLVLSSCADVARQGGRDLTPAGSDTEIAVSIVNRQIQVADITPSPKTHGAIKWTIITAGNYTFPRDGIVIDPGHFDCSSNQAGSRTFKCKKRGHKSGDQFKYIVNVNEGTTSLPPLDPWIDND